MYIAIRKLSEDDAHAVYSFGTTESDLRRIQIAKSSGQVELLDQSPGGEPDGVFLRVARKLEEHWAKGEYPSATCWAS